MNMVQAIPEFLCFKYKGVRRIDQVLADPVKIGWRCRKYQNWKEIYSAADDKKFLLAVADRLIEKGSFSPSDFGRFSRIMFNVQRWRKDKKEFALEPDHHPSWATVDCLLAVVRENPKVALQKMQKDVPGFSRAQPAYFWEFFYSHTLAALLQLQGVPRFQNLVPAAGFTDSESADRVADTLTKELYDCAGLQAATKTKSTARERLGGAFSDLGFGNLLFDVNFSAGDFTSPAPTAMVLKYQQLEPSRLLRLDEVEGSARLTINSSHGFVQEASKEPSTQAVMEAILVAYAEATRKLPAQRDTCETVSSYMGLLLRKRGKPT